MIVSQTAGAIKRFKRTPWRFQQTVEIPSGEEIARFVSIVLSAQTDLQEVTVTINEIIFDVAQMKAFLGARDGAELTRDSSLTAQGLEEAQELLTAAFWDGNEFTVIPVPKPYVIYADHHGWATFYANTKGNLNGVIEPLESQEYKLVMNWQRKL